MNEMAKPPAKPFWRAKSLEEMTPEDWESLCDGCGRCCLVKLEDEKGEVHYTDIACRLFDGETCRCRDYPNRRKRVRECVLLTPETVRESASWMPKTCAYRLLAEGRDLPEWHPLVCGDPEGPLKAGILVKGRTVSEKLVRRRDWEKRILRDPI